jgi:DNA-binding NarL/FixJ family response regulator
MTRHTRIKVVIADGQPVVVSGLRRWFEARERFRVSASALDVAQLLDKMEHIGGDLVVMGGTLGGEAGSASSAFADNTGTEDLALLRELKRRYPEVPLIALTQRSDAATLRAMQDAGAAGIVSSRDDMRELERICIRVLSGATRATSKRIAALLATTQVFNAPAPYRAVRVSVKASGAPV